MNYLQEYYQKIKSGEIIVGNELMSVLEGLMEDLKILDIIMIPNQDK